MNNVRLLSMDFDGTLVSESDRPPFPAELIDALNLLRSAGVRLALNTGRTIDLVDTGLAVNRFPIRPDYALTTERELYRWNGSNWEAFEDWNHVCEQRHEELYQNSLEFLSELETIALNLEGTRIHRESDRFVGVITANSRQMDEFCAYVDQRRDGLPEFSYQRNSIYLRFCHLDYNKGTVLAELQRLLGFSPEETFAVGDNFNDLPMLDAKFARYLACPTNSIAEVKSAVENHGGIVATKKSGLGVAQALRQFFPQFFSK
jgi:hydroxymethylpyrimidine pyrophosphatase-like HAD family hydrolase